MECINPDDVKDDIIGRLIKKSYLGVLTALTVREDMKMKLGSCSLHRLSISNSVILSRAMVET